jgi:hypothetical protein
MAHNERGGSTSPSMTTDHAPPPRKRPERNATLLHAKPAKRAQLSGTTWSQFRSARVYEMLWMATTVAGWPASRSVTIGGS